MKTLHVVGYKNSGKTTLISRWVRWLKKQGLSVAVLKHHGHGGKPEMPGEGTDTDRFLDSGADATLVAGGGSIQFIWNEEPEFMLLKTLISQGKPDILLIEGYKREKGDKVILLRNKEDWDALRDLEGMQLVIGCSGIKPDCMHIDSRESERAIDEWFAKWIAEGAGG
ncbi:molybdopterin-guanine dinucleotide biosynthesis protein B [Sporosarcina sp. Te-1]|uniref:molybdopterin-guanine dinucleotide biosynthesis protein B n=1 Tax=Sporosarcina sp. Te-1 TaxID=2818390 RepID=UPI001A9D6616|nr:molybdopterin-guanine dinucleotide biosynthesis protein B [Sporosarcina sp. Te-1]QTD40555.1 molybdopterin-guanine dinucleotide biosynthesis protein B [Sporosarcina sp. Te-1]